jgi:hypothetical protein
MDENRKWVNQVDIADFQSARDALNLLIQMLSTMRVIPHTHAQKNAFEHTLRTLAEYIESKLRANVSVLVSKEQDSDLPW